MEQLSDLEQQQVTGSGAVGFFSGAIVGAVAGGLVSGNPFGVIAGFWGGGVLGSEAEDYLSGEIDDAVNNGGSGVNGPTVVVR